MKQLSILLAVFMGLNSNLRAESSKKIVSDIIVNTSLQNAWALWTTEEGVKSWLHIDAAVIEPRFGGAYELYFAPDHSDNNTKDCKILTYEPFRKLVFQWKGPSSLAVMNDQPLPTRVEVQFESLEKNKTRLHFQNIGYGEGTEWESAYNWFTRAWFGAFEDLKNTH